MNAVLNVVSDDEGRRTTSKRKTEKTRFGWAVLVDDSTPLLESQKVRGDQVSCVICTFRKQVGYPLVN